MSAAIVELAGVAVAAVAPVVFGLHRVHAAIGKLAAPAPAAPAPAATPTAPAAPAVAAPPLTTPAPQAATRRVKQATLTTGTRHHGAKSSMVTDGTWLHVTEGGTTKSYPISGGVYWLELLDD